MAKSNRDRVSDVMYALKEGLGPFILREFKMVYKASGYLTEIESALTTNAHDADYPDEAAALEKIDTQGWLNLMIRRWNEVFKSKLGHAQRSFVSELLEARNKWGHQKPITNDDALRIADTAKRLLDDINAPKEAEICHNIATELLRLRFDAEQKQSVKQPTTGDLTAAPTTTKPGLKPWRHVVKPHPDVASGRYVQAEFAADLAQVVQGKADPEYGDPKEFFRRTYITEGLRDLLVTGVKRLTGQGGDPVVQLQTSFGGGKTHSMLALYHLFSGKIGFSEIPDGESVVKLVGDIDDHITANRAVIVGTAFSAPEPRNYGNVSTNTLWGEIAYQLGGEAGYSLVKSADVAGVSPGSDTLLELLEKHGPALIIIDELVAFARNLYGVVERLPAGTFDSVMTFAQSLTEAVKRSSDSMLLVSIPESDIEIGGEGGKATLEILAKTIGRIESVWKPVTATESFEIVRRRLFTSDVDHAARDAVLSGFREMYAGNSSDFPSGVAEGDYFARMRDAYPIHPELFARLYEDWSTLDRFQRTRGVLRLMATVIHRLWQDNDQSLLIMPCSIPLWRPTVRNEMLRYLPETWPAIVDADIDGEESKPFQLDKSNPNLGQLSASRRVARAIFVGSAPSVAGQSVRGVEEVRIRLATAQPGENIATFNDALRRMSNQLTYLYSDGSRYWYDTRPTVNRMAQDRAQNINPDLVEMEAVSRLRAVKFNKQEFAAAHVAPNGSADIVDDARARVVVLALEHAHKKGPDPSLAQVEALNIVRNRGNSPRHYSNMLVFIAPDANAAEAWVTSIKEYLAWKSILDDSEKLNLDVQQRKQVEGSVKRTEETLLSRLQETYSWLLVPVQPDGARPEIDIEAQRISGSESFYDRAARKLRSSELLIHQWSPDNLYMELGRYPNLWGENAHLSIKKLWEYLASYCYLPRLYDENVLIEAIADGISRSDAPFGYATMVEADGTYKGLAYGKQAKVYFDDSSVLVRPDAAAAQLAQDIAVIPPAPSGRATSLFGDDVDAPAHSEPEPQLTTRYHGTVTLDPLRANKDMATIVEEVIQRLTSLTGTNVRITVELSAERPAGFDDATIRTVSENSRTLKFKHYGFED